MQNRTYITPYQILFCKKILLLGQSRHIIFSHKPPRINGSIMWRDKRQSTIKALSILF